MLLMSCGPRLGKWHNIHKLFTARDNLTAIINYFSVIFPANHDSHMEDKLCDIKERINIILELIEQKVIAGESVIALDNFLQTITPGKRQEAAACFVQMTTDEPERMRTRSGQQKACRNSILLKYLATCSEKDSCSAEMVNSVSKLREFKSLEDVWEHILIPGLTAEEMIRLAKHVNSFFPLIRCKETKHDIWSNFRKEKKKEGEAHLQNKIEIINDVRLLLLDPDGEAKLANGKLIFEDKTSQFDLDFNIHYCLKLLHEHDLEFSSFLLNKANEYFGCFKQPKISDWSYFSFLEIIKSIPSENLDSTFEMAKKILENVYRQELYAPNTFSFLERKTFAKLTKILSEVPSDQWKLAFETAALYFNKNLTIINSANLVLGISKIIETYGMRAVWILNFMIQSMGSEFFMTFGSGSDDIVKKLQRFIEVILKKYGKEEDTLFQEGLSCAFPLVDKEVYSLLKNGIRSRGRHNLWFSPAADNHRLHPPRE